MLVGGLLHSKGLQRMSQLRYRMPCGGSIADAGGATRSLQIFLSHTDAILFNRYERPCPAIATAFGAAVCRNLHLSRIVSVNRELYQIDVGHKQRIACSSRLSIRRRLRGLENAAFCL